MTREQVDELARLMQQGRAARKPEGIENADLGSSGRTGDFVSGFVERLGWPGSAGVGERGAEEAVCPVLGVAAGVGEDELNFGVAHLESGELVGEPAAIDVLELVERGVSGLDHNGGVRELGE